MDTKKPSTVYFCPRITPENLVKVYEMLNRPVQGRVCAKLSTGEGGNPNHLSVDVIKQLIEQTNATIVECNTTYEGTRNTTPAHMQTAREHGFTAIADVDIMDRDDDVALPVPGNPKHIKENFVGKNWLDYDFTMVLSHFKGHIMAGFGGALKNVAIGMASAKGKSLIHTAGVSEQVPLDFTKICEQDDFLESMAEACASVFKHAGNNILFISVANNLSVDCDCAYRPEPAKISDIGILASLDPVALDRACVDMIYNNPEPGKKDLIERMEGRHATHLLDYAEQIGLGQQNYEIVNVEPVPFEFE